MEIQAKAKFIRQSPRKVRLVVNLIKGLSAPAAADQLRLLPKRAAGTVLKVLNSAVANAKHNKQLSENNLYVQTAFVDQGPTLKRFTPKAFGRAGAIRKRTSHITIVLAEKVVANKTENKDEHILSSPRKRGSRSIKEKMDSGSLQRRAGKAGMTDDV